MTSTKDKKYFWHISSPLFNLIYAIFTFAAYNFNFVVATFNHNQSVLGTFLVSVCIFAVLNIILSILFWQKTTKILAVLFCFANTAAFYFMNTYGVMIDKIMLLNVLQTDVYEVADLLSFRMLSYLIIFAIIPSYLIIKTDITFTASKTDIRNKTVACGLSLLIASAVISGGLCFNRNILKEYKPLKNALIPANYIGAIISVTKIKMQYIGIELKKISENAIMLPQKEGAKPNLIVVIIGESARDANFSLSGYERPTNQPLEKYADELIYFDNFYSCGTATAVSLPCIFSPDPRRKFEPESEKYTENVLDIIDYAGYKLLWRENNTDCKDNCNRIEQERFCNVKECPDEILLTNFAKKITSTDLPTLVVLHQRGSHGPLYGLRYPKEFETYKPICKEEILQKCSNQELVNVYDNTVLYTSHMLAQTIEELKALENKYNIAMLFTSDHGESLGENGIYLHSAPYDTAPDEQKHIPTMLWFSKDYIADNNLDFNCVRKIKSNYFSHDNVFHTLLGMTKVHSPLYDKNLDMLASCRK